MNRLIKKNELYRVIEHRRVDNNILEITEYYMRNDSVISRKTTRIEN